MATTAQTIATLIEGLNLSEEQVSILTQNLATVRSQALIELDADVDKAKEGSRLTKQGHDLLAKAVAGKELHYTRVAFGDSMVDGQLIEPTDEEKYQLNDMIHWKLDLPMADVSFTGAGTATVRFSVQNQNIDEGFFIREIGLFASDPDTGEEVLYCYRNSGVLSDYIPAGGGAVAWSFIMSLITVVDSATNVTAVIDANLAFVSQVELSEHINSTHPHPNCPSVGPAVTTSAYFWALGEDVQLHPISLENLRRAILGGEALDIPKMSSRLAQAENNISNLYLQLNADRELGLQANLLLVEDLQNFNFCDTYDCKVITQVAGINTITLESDQGILAGHWYTIADGVHSEYVQIKSVAKNSGSTVAILETNLVYTYYLPNTRFMRTTALLSEGVAMGAGDMRGVSFDYSSTTWRGTGSNVSTALTLDTNFQNAGAFDLSGDYAFTTAGEFTLAQ